MLRRSRIEDDDVDLDDAALLGATDPAEEAKPVTLNGLRMLVVNDDAHSCELIARLVESIGCRARRVHAAEGVVEFLSDPMNEIGGVILDLRAGVTASAPVLDGIRRLSGAQGQIPVVVLTSTSDDAGPVWEAGGDAFMARPFHAEDFLDEVTAVLQRSSAERADARASRLSA